MGNSAHANIILLAPTDNVVVACEEISAGSSIEVEGSVITVKSDVGLGHKIARHDINPKDKILKYGAPIGRAVDAIDKGAHVHVHNIESDYLHSHTARQAEGETQ